MNTTFTKLRINFSTNIVRRRSAVVASSLLVRWRNSTIISRTRFVWDPRRDNRTTVTANAVREACGSADLRIYGSEDQTCPDALLIDDGALSPVQSASSAAASRFDAQLTGAEFMYELFRSNFDNYAKRCVIEWNSSVFAKRLGKFCVSGSTAKIKICWTLAKSFARCTIATCKSDLIVVKVQARVCVYEKTSKRSTHLIW